MSRNTKPRKAEYAMLNTWTVDVGGSIIDFDNDEFVLEKRLFAVNFTCESYETFSITDCKTGIQYNVPFKTIQELIDIARKERKKKHS